jgi:hypothetical protein
MPMSEPNRIDISAEDTERGKLLLVITEHRPWDDSGLMDNQFEAKVQAYTDYIRSPVFAERHPGRGPHDVIIQLGCRVPPSEHALALFERTRQDLQRQGIGFEHQVMARRT